MGMIGKNSVVHGRNDSFHRDIPRDSLQRLNAEKEAPDGGFLPCCAQRMKSRS